MSAERTQNQRVFRDNTTVPIPRTFDARPSTNVSYDRGVVGPERESYELRDTYFEHTILISNPPGW